MWNNPIQSYSLLSECNKLCWMSESNPNNLSIYISMNAYFDIE
jgi:hypothetical protein